MTEQLKRRNLLAAVQPTEPLPQEAIGLVAEKNGFSPPPSVAAAPASPERGVRRQRQLTGRDHQFNVRLRRDTLDFIYGQANARNIPVAQVIEEAIELLQRAG